MNEGPEIPHSEIKPPIESNAIKPDIDPTQKIEKPDSSQETSMPEGDRLPRRFLDLRKKGDEAAKAFRNALNQALRPQSEVKSEDASPPGATTSEGVSLDSTSQDIQDEFEEAQSALQALNAMALGSLSGVMEGLQAVTNPREALLKLMNERDHKDIPTIMESGGDFENVVKEFKDKDPNSVNVTVWLGAGQGCNNAAGEALAFQDMGVWDNIDGAVCVSSGAAPVWYGVGTTKDGPITVADGASIVFVDNAGEGVEQNKLFDINRLGRFHRRNNLDNLYDINALMRSLRRKPVDMPRIKNSKTQMYFGVTDANTGNGEMLHVNAMEDPYKALEGTINIPVVTGEHKVAIKGEDGKEIDAIDGSIACRPIQFALEKFYQPGKKLNVLVLKQTPLDSPQDNTWDMIALAAGWSRNPEDKVARKALKKALRANKQLMQEELAFLDGSRQLPEGMNANNVRIAYMAPKQTGVSALTQDSEALKKAYLQMYEQTMEMFGEAPQRDLADELETNPVYQPASVEKAA